MLHAPVRLGRPLFHLPSGERIQGGVTLQTLLKAHSVTNIIRIIGLRQPDSSATKAQRFS